MEKKGNIAAVCSTARLALSAPPDDAPTVGRPAVASGRLVPVPIKVVVERQFFPRLDVFNGENPNGQGAVHGPLR